MIRRALVTSLKTVSQTPEQIANEQYSLGYRSGYDLGYENGRNGEMKERDKYFEMTIEEARELYKVLAPQFTDSEATLVHAVIKRLRYV